jgi:hypothetical protein
MWVKGKGKLSAVSNKIGKYTSHEFTHKNPTNPLKKKKQHINKYTIQNAKIWVLFVCFFANCQSKYSFKTLRSLRDSSTHKNPTNPQKKKQNINKYTIQNAKNLYFVCLFFKTAKVNNPVKH